MSERNYKYRLPEVLEAHRQTANWLVGLSAGALAGFATFLDRPRVHGSLEEWLLGLTGLFFLLAICAGVAFHLSITLFTNNYEQHARAEESIEKKEADLKKTKDTSDTDSVKATEENIKRLTEQLGDCEKHKKTWHRWYKIFYRILTACFYVALVFGAWYIGVSATERIEPASAGDVLLLDGRYQTDACKGYSALLLDTKTGQVFELHNDEVTGGTRWDLAHAHVRKVCADSVQVVPMQQATGKKGSLAEPDRTQSKVELNTDPERSDGTP